MPWAPGRGLTDSAWRDWRWFLEDMTFEVDRQEMGSLRQMGRTGRTEGEGASRTWGTPKGPEVL